MEEARSRRLGVRDMVRARAGLSNLLELTNKVASAARARTTSPTPLDSDTLRDSRSVTAARDHVFGITRIDSEAGAS
jgi:hypothetical protein